MPWLDLEGEIAEEFEGLREDKEWLAAVELERRQKEKSRALASKRDRRLELARLKSRPAEYALRLVADRKRNRDAWERLKLTPEKRLAILVKRRERDRKYRERVNADPEKRVALQRRKRERDKPTKPATVICACGAVIVQCLARGNIKMSCSRRCKRKRESHGKQRES